MKNATSGHPQETTSIQREWTLIAKEHIVVSFYGGSIYAFGSELACLRLFKKFSSAKCKPRVEYSNNLETWFFRKD